MELYIMGNRVNFTIQNERNVKDVIESLSEVVSRYGHSIVELKVDGKIFYPENPELEKIDINTISSLEVETSSFFEISSFLILSLEPYVEKFLDYIKIGKVEFSIFEEAREWIIDVLSSSTDMIFFFGSFSKLKEEREEIINFFKNISYNQLESMKDEIIEKLLKLKVFLKNLSRIISEINEKGDILFDSSIDNSFSSMLRLIDEIPIEIQTGNIKQVLKNVKEFSEEFSKSIVYVNLAITLSYKYPFLREVLKDKDIEVIRSIKDSIEKITSAIRNQDYVLASDIIEYELSDQIREYMRFYEKIREATMKEITIN